MGKWTDPRYDPSRGSVQSGLEAVGTHLERLFIQRNIIRLSCAENVFMKSASDSEKMNVKMAGPTTKVTVYLPLMIGLCKPLTRNRELLRRFRGAPRHVGSSDHHLFFQR